MDLPYEKLSIFARRYESSDVLVQMPVFVIAELGVVDDEDGPAAPPANPPDDGSTTGDNPPKDPPIIKLKSFRDQATSARPTRKPKVHVPLGMLCTDHTGYASFDLGVLRSETVVAALHRENVVPLSSSLQEPRDNRLSELVRTRGKKTDVLVGLVHLWVLPFADPVLIVDALAEADVGPSYLTLRLELDERRLENRIFNSSAAMPSMQNPGILDYKMSPGSFSLASAVVFGGEGSCEALMPSNLSTQAFRFQQVARIPGATQGSNFAQARDTRMVTGFRLGYIFDYTTEWFPIGHSLGSLTYSLPLAPGEVVKIAVVDWSRADSASRGEDTGFSESLVHDTLRDRTLGESVTAMLDEWQRGGSVMGGVAVSGAYGGGGTGVGAAGALGGAYTTSSGTRTLTGETSQQVADAFHQSTSAMRELRSTVVVQNVQAEKSNVQTRTVANYNHGHALTMLYYEVLRHYRVVTRLSGARLALLLDYGMRKPNFRDEGFLLAYRRELETVLLDDRLQSSFDAVASVRQGRAKFEDANKNFKPNDPGAALISQLAITISTGSDGSGGTDGDPYVNLTFTDNAQLPTTQIEPNDDSNNARHLGHPGFDDFEQGDVGTYGLRPQAPFEWKKLRGFVVGLEGGGDWRIDHLKLEGSTAIGDRITLFDADYRQDLANDTTTTEFFTIKPPPAPPAPELKTFVNAADLEMEDRLMSHLESHSYYYNRYFWLSENANARAAEFDALTLNNQPVLDLIENKAVEISGNWVAFPVAPGGGGEYPVQILENLFKWSDRDPASASDPYVEQLLSLPTRGVFAEAKLGHCNANEIIDNTRFWDWQKSPIPYQAPEITGVDAGSRSQPPTGLNPTLFPQSLVNIVSPQAVPDPTGLADALKVLGTPNIFRDQSGAQQVGTLLGKLSDNATSLASQGLKSGERENLMNDIRNAPELTKDQKSKLIGDLLTKEVNAGSPAKAPAGTEDAGNTGSGAGSGTSPQTGPGPSGGNKTPTPTPNQDNGTPTPAPTTPTPTPKPTPAPGPGKPKKSDPLPKTGGLMFQLNFHRVKVDKTVTGRATVTVKPAGAGINHDPNAYVPGVSTGPPTSAQARAAPEQWKDVPIVDGTLWLQSDHADAPGTIIIDVTYDISVVTRADLINGVFIAPSAPDVNEKNSTYTWNNSKAYKQPTAGSTVVLNITPEVTEVSCPHSWKRVLISLTCYLRNPSPPPTAPAWRRSWVPRLALRPKY